MVDDWEGFNQAGADLDDMIDALADREEAGEPPGRSVLFFHAITEQQVNGLAHQWVKPIQGVGALEAWQTVQVLIATVYACYERIDQLSSDGDAGVD